jgi:hypothetical protein
MKTKRRWLTSVLAASTEKQPALPFARGQRRRPASLAPQTSSAALAPRKAG